MLRTICIATSVALLSACAQQSMTALSGPVTKPEAAQGQEWQWVGKTSERERLEVAQPEQYTLEFQPDGRVLARFDCNRGNGRYEIGEGTLSFGPIATTRMACLPGSLDTTLMQALGRVEGFRVEDGDLWLQLADDAGMLRFRPAP